jgi:YVTN family beta-propeller protein/autotransporter-associated beta strand protein
MNSSQQAERLTSLLKQARMSGRISPAGQNFRRQRIFYLMFWLFGTASILSSRLAYGYIEADAFISDSFTSTVTVINTRTGEVIRQSIPLASTRAVPSGVAIGPDGRYVYIADQAGNTVSVLDARTYQVIGTIPVGNGPVGVAVSPSGKFAYVANQFDNTVSVIVSRQAVGNPIVFDGANEGGPYGIAIEPGGLYAYVTNSNTSEVSVVNLSTGQVVATPTVTEGPIAVTVSANKQYVYVTSGNNKTSVVSVISTATNQVVSSYPLKPVLNTPYGIAVTSDGRYAYIANDAGGNVIVINAMTGAYLQTIAVGNLPVGVSITPNGQYVYVTNLGDSSVSVIATATNALVKTIRIGDLSRPSLIGSGPFSLGSFIGPNIIVRNGGPLLLPSDAALTPLGFGQFVDFDGGTLELIGNLTTSREISLLALGGIIDTNGFEAAISGDIIGLPSGSLTKDGTGTLLLGGNNTYPSTTVVNSGTLKAASTRGFSPNSAFRINQGGTLDLAGYSNGVASIAGAGLVTNSGVTAARLTAGNYTQKANGTLAIQIRSDTNFDQLEVKDKANLNGALTVSLPAGFVPRSGQQFVFLTAQGGVSGHFSSLQGPAGVSLKLRYTENAVSLTLNTFDPVEGLAGNSNGVYPGNGTDRSAAGTPGARSRQ